MTSGSPIHTGMSNRIGGTSATTTNNYTSDPRRPVSGVSSGDSSNGGGKRGDALSVLPSRLQTASSMVSLTSNVSRPSGHRDGFEYPSDVRKKARRKVAVTGSRTSHGRLKGAPEPSRHIFVYRLDKCVSDKDMSSYMTEYDVMARKVEKVSNSDAKYNSFKVEIKISDLTKVLDGAFWPMGICVRRYYESRTRT